MNREKPKPISPNRLNTALGGSHERHAAASSADDFRTRKSPEKKFSIKLPSPTSTGNTQPMSAKPVFGRRKP